MSIPNYRLEALTNSESAMDEEFPALRTNDTWELDYFTSR